MADRAYVEFGTVENLSLFRLHLALAKNEIINNRLGSLANELNVPNQLVRVCAERLDVSSHCEIVKRKPPVSVFMGKGAEEFLEIKALGIQKVESWREEKYRQVALESKLPPSEWEFESEWEIEENVASSEFPETVPASVAEDVWEPLPLEASETEIAEAADEVEELIDVVRSDNGYTSTHPEEQKSILWALGSGVNALREGLVTRYTLENFLRNPLKKLIERFKDAAIQTFAQKIIEKILSLFSGN